uniref:Transposon TX1 uncharacterized n=1 Tax=Cajanus cajan TaxID=3821 RepID=A0A151RED4_CAJCA|nr:Transposon TX1 uncharacterized [Cajanus cajan]
MVKFDLEADRERVMHGGPWMLFDHYLIVRPWSLKFVASATKVDSTLVWVRLPGLGVMFYDESVLLTIASAIGKPVKVDLNTLNMTRDRFARVCVEINLNVPVVGKFFLNGVWYNVEYKGLHLLCSACGCYGHVLRNCNHANRTELLAHEIQAQDHAIPSYSTKAVQTEKEPRTGFKHSRVVRLQSREQDHASGSKAFDGGHRGAVNAKGKRRVAELVRLHHPSIFIILETHCQFSSVESFWLKMDYSKSWVCTAVYASPRVELRQRVWAHLRELGGRITLPWLVLGDFNEIMLSTECRGGRFSTARASQFLEVLNDCNLLDMGAKGLRFTWVVLAKRLDCAVCNVAWQAMFPEAYVENLCRVYCDHCPLLLRREGSRDKAQDRPFQFEAAWATHKGFERIVREAWGRSTPTLANGLQAVRVDAIKFNKEVFGNIITRKKALQRRLRGVQLQLEIGESESLSRLEKTIQAELDETCLQEEYLWFHKSREKWVRFGDRNTSFFHAQTLARRRRNKIQGLFLPDGSWHTDPMVMKNETVRFDKELFSSNNEQGPFYMHAGVPPGLGVEAQSALTAPVTKEEVRRAVMRMKSFKAPRSDGFQSFFFKQYWPIVGEELWRIVKDAFRLGFSDISLLETQMVLIPKVDHPVSLKEFRPISLCNVA